MQKRNVVRSSTPHQSCNIKPLECEALRLKCPCSRDAPTRTWICSGCFQTIDYDFAEVCYCGCGKARFEQLAFRCTNEAHGDAWKKIDSDRLTEVLGQLKPLRHLNFLVMGETGVGKTTWINAFANYVTYSTLEEATENEPICLIPCYFTTTDAQFESRIVRLGSSENEFFYQGRSCTKEPRTYTFNCIVKNDKEEDEEVLIRLIDTPGVNHTDSESLDESNMEKILDHIGNYKELHGICILIKANENRLTKNFLYCLKELIKQLHFSALGNVFFCFTHTKTSEYTAGESFQTIKNALLKLGNKLKVKIQADKSNAFCLENEAFRFLCGLKCGVFERSAMSSVAFSWTRSVEETQRLIDVAMRKPAHLIQETTSLHDAKRTVRILAKPMADIAENIAENLIEIEAKEVEISQHTGTLEELKSKLTLTQVRIDTRELASSQTVCISENCVALAQARNCRYKVCHEKCSVPPSVGTIPNKGLKNCRAFSRWWKFTQLWRVMKDMRCNVCGCNWDQHKQVSFHQEKVEEVKKLIVDEITTLVDTRSLIADLNKKFTSLESSLEFIIDCAVRFNAFLKKNRSFKIREEEDVFLYHLKNAIKERPFSAKDRSVNSRIEEIIARYRRKQKDLKENPNSSLKVPEYDCIAELRRELFKIDEYGKQIEELYQQTLKGNTRAMKLAETVYKPPLHVRVERKHLSRQAPQRLSACASDDWKVHSFRQVNEETQRRRHEYGFPLTYSTYSSSQQFADARLH